MSTKPVARLVIVLVLLVGCASGRTNEGSAGYCLGMSQVTNVLRDWPQQAMTERQATTTLAKAYLNLAVAAAADFSGQAQLGVTAFSDDVGRLKLAIEAGVGVHTATAAIRQAIPSLPACRASSGH